MLPNYLLSLVNPKAEKVKVMNYLYLAEAEKSDLIFCCHRPFASIFVFLHIHFFVAHNNTLLCYISFCIRPYACIFLIDIVYILSIPFFILYYIIFFVFCFPSVFLILIFHRCPIFHWIVVGKLLCLFFNSLGNLCV